MAHMVKLATSGKPQHSHFPKLSMGETYSGHLAKVDVA